MTYTYKANTNGTCEIKLDGTKIDTVGPWETKAEAEVWGSAVCDKYNSPEYAECPYPNSLLEEVTND
jgi:hypothetical protein